MDLRTGLLVLFLLAGSCASDASSLAAGDLLGNMLLIFMINSNIIPFLPGMCLCIILQSMPS